MYRYSRGIFVTILASFLAQQGAASESNPAEPTVVTKKGRFFDNVVPVPALFYTPETGWGGGLGIVHSYRQDDDPPDVQDSTLIPLALYTERHQTLLRIYLRNFLQQGLYYSDLALSYNNYPDRFFGIGGETKVDDREAYIEELMGVAWDFSRRVLSRHLYAGLALRYDDWAIRNKQPDGQLVSANILGSHSGIIRGVGLRLSHNDRNNVFAATRGGRHDLSFIRHAKALGSEFEYDQWELRLRHYWSLTPQDVIAAELALDAMSGDVPFRKLAMLGGQFRTRGIYLGRFRDKSAASVQLDYRTWFNQRWGMVAFLSSGWVAPTVSELADATTHFTYGLGGRYMINLERRMDFRLDYARAKDSKAVYFGVGEAF